jgi:isocitrate dehydrogenase
MKDNNSELIKFSEKIEKEVIGAVEDGVMTKDLAMIVHQSNLRESHYVNT